MFLISIKQVKATFMQVWKNHEKYQQEIKSKRKRKVTFRTSEKTLE